MAETGRIQIFVDGSGSGHSAAHFSDNEVYLTYQKGATNNEAEYNGVLLALEHLPVGAKATILSDSQLIVNQLNGKFKINFAHLQQKRQTIESLIKTKRLDVKIDWIPREKNKADADIRNRHAASESPKNVSVKVSTKCTGNVKPESILDRLKRLENENALLQGENIKLREQVVELKVRLG